MRKRIEWLWEVLDEHTSRAKVLGGWVILHRGLESNGKGISASESMCFVCDKDHEWHIAVAKVDPVVERSTIAKDYIPAKD